MLQFGKKTNKTSGNNLNERYKMKQLNKRITWKYVYNCCLNLIANNIKLKICLVKI